MTTPDTHTVQLHRVLRAPAERIYRAFLDADAMVKWVPPNGYTGTVHHLAPQVGGGYKMSFTNFSTGKRITFGGEYLELVPNELLRYTDRFDDPALPETMLVTVRLKALGSSTEVHITQADVPATIPAEACYLCWQESLALLAQLVEAEIPRQASSDRV